MIGSSSAGIGGSGSFLMPFYSAIIDWVLEIGIAAISSVVYWYERAWSFSSLASSTLALRNTLDLS